MQRGVGRGRTHSMHQPSALARNTSSGVTCTDHVTQTLGAQRSKNSGP